MAKSLFWLYWEPGYTFIVVQSIFEKSLDADRVFLETGGL